MIPSSLLTTATPAGSALHRIEEMTDARRMGPRIAAAFGAAGPVPCHVLDAKLEPGARCTVLYGVGGGLVRGDLLTDGTGDRAADGVRDEDEVGDGVPARPVVDPGVRLSRFPDDPDLPGLAVAADPARLRWALRDALPGAGSAPRCRVELLRYRPGRRATLGVHLREAAPARRRLVVKSYHDGRKAAAVAAEGVLLAATVDPATPLRFAPVRAHVPDLGLVVQEHVTGVGLDGVLAAGGPRAADALRRAAVALAALHARPTVSSRTRAVGAELLRFRARGLRVAEVDPAAGTALVDLADRLAGAAQDVPPGVVVLVHGDCKPSQFLMREEDVVLLDLDSCGQGDPAGDVGTFLATLRQRTLRQVATGRAAPAAARAGDALAELFLAAYLSAAGGCGQADMRRRVTWYEAVAAERKALRSFYRAPRSPVTWALVEHGHSCLDRLGGAR